MNPAYVDSLELITLTRKLQWILMLLSILPCLALVILVAWGKSRVYWLIGLSLVVGLLFVRFSNAKVKPIRVIETPLMPALSEVTLTNEDEFIAGFVWEEHAYALPYRSLCRTPIVQITDFDKRLIVIHSQFANSTTALQVSRDIRASDLEYVASPMNSALMYNRKFGEFTVGITGQTESGQKPYGVQAAVPVEHMPLSEWRKLYPRSRLMVPTERDDMRDAQPARPYFPVKLEDSSLPSDTPIILIHSSPKAAILLASELQLPLNTKAGNQPVVLWRDGNRLRAFNRQVDQDLFLTFSFKKDKKFNITLVDNQTNSTWNMSGICTTGQLEGKRLKSVPVEEGVYWGVTKAWFKDIRILRDEGIFTKNPAK